MAPPREASQLTDERRPLPERLYDAGVVDLIPVIPPGAALAPSSTIPSSSLGKSPGIRLPNGLWCGTRWQSLRPTADDVRTWLQWGASIGLKTERFPCVDIDCADPALADIVQQAAESMLGPAPIRTGNHPKRALAYRTDAPFGKMKLTLRKKDKTYLVEILGAGQQFVIHGEHATTGRPYSWDRDPATTPLRPITREGVQSFLEYLKETAEMLGYDCERIGDGAARVARSADQAALVAPSIEELRRAVGLIPNTLELFGGWDEYIKMLHALRAAAGDEDEAGYEIFAEWASRWEGHGLRHADSNDAEERRALWRRTRGPYSVGWPWIAELARPYGYDDTPFEADAETAPTKAEAGHRPPPFLSDQWLADKVTDAARGVLRFVPKNDIWLVWGRSYWQPDAELQAEDTIKLELRRIAHWLEGYGATEKEKAQSARNAVKVCSAGTLTAVARLVKMDRSIALSPELLDHNPWILNTPGGVVDLKTGRMLPPDPDQLCTRRTSVAPDFGGKMARWTQFLEEVTRGDVPLQGYLKRLCGYCLTGSTQEQMYAFIFGDGGNGKGKFVETVTGILGTYHRDSPMETFIASSTERHPTELAHLAGARFVTASETEAGKRWDEARLKRMTGGDPITARAMREDFFTFTPQFKLVFIGNHRPEIRNLDEAMRRRTHLVPFLFKPPVVDQQLAAKLRAEYPAILAWMIEGCLEWQAEGLNPPPVVRAATEEYFAETDTLGAWLAECTEPADETTEMQPLYDSWVAWCGRRREVAGRSQTFSAKMALRYQKKLAPQSRRAAFAGLRLKDGYNPLEGLVAG